MLDETNMLAAPFDGAPEPDPAALAASERGNALAQQSTAALAEYHVLKPDEELAEAIQNIVANCKLVLRASGMYSRVRINHNLYYARDGAQQWEENLKPDGEFGDSIRMSVNVLRNLIRHILSMVNSVKPVLDPKAASTDSESIAETDICRSLLEQYMYGEKHVKFVNRAVEHSPVLGCGLIHRYIDRFGGGAYAGGDASAIPEGMPAKYGLGPDGASVATVFKPAICHENPSVVDVYFDQSANSWDQVDEVVIRVPRNRYNLIALHPESAGAIADAPTRSTDKFDEYLPNPVYGTTKGLESPAQRAQIEVWYYYHRKTVAVPNGKQVVMLPTGEVLDSGDLEWEEIPLYRMTPEEIIGSVHGYAPATSMGGLQEALDIGASAMITNIAAYARNIIVTDKGTEIEPGDLTGDMKLLQVDFDERGNPPIKVLELLKLPPEVQNAMEWIVGKMEQDAGVNKIVRGDPGSVTAGVSINLFQAMTMQFASPLEEARAHALEWMADGIIEFHQKYPDVDRDLQIAGKNKKSELVQFYGNKIKRIRRVLVDMGNPMSRTVAGRLQMLQAIREQGAPLAPEKAMQVLATGNLDSATDGVVTEQNFILAENERLADGQQCPVIPGDDHLMHIREHRAVAANPDVRFDQAKLAILQEHIDMHVHYWLTGDVTLAIARGAIPMTAIPRVAVQPPAGAGAPAPNPGAPHPSAAPHGPPRGAPPPKPPDPIEMLRPPSLTRLPPVDQK